MLIFRNNDLFETLTYEHHRAWQQAPLYYKEAFDCLQQHNMSHISTYLLTPYINHVNGHVQESRKEGGPLTQQHIIIIFQLQTIAISKESNNKKLVGV